MAARLKPLLLGLVAAPLWVTACHAQLADPTKPPLVVSAPATEAGGAAQAATGLQSVIMRKSGKPAALINGEVVELGGKLGEARLIRIDEDAVVLKGPEGEETLRLTPAAEKKVGAGETAKRDSRETAKSEKKGTEK
jgi:MSHA biogenesis protein MshK